MKRLSKVLLLIPSKTPRSLKAVQGRCQVCVYVSTFVGSSSAAAQRRALATGRNSTGGASRMK
jgi:hypothetical protein